MTRNWWSKCLAGAAATAMLVVASCNQTPGGEASRWDSDAWVGSTPTQKTEPAPRKEEPAPAPRRIFGGCPAYNPPAGAGMAVSSMAFPTGSASTSAVMVHQVMPREVRLGKNYDYELHVSNLTEGTLQNVIVTLEDQANQTIVTSTPPSSRGAANATQWVLGDLAGCKTTVIKVTAKADKGGSSSNCISVTYNNAMCAATNVVEPALAITKTAPAEVLLCDTIVMKIEVKNTGTATLNNVRVKDNLPANMTTSPDNKSAVDASLTTLAPGQVKIVEIKAKASKTGSYDNSATATADGDISANSNKTTTVVKQPVLTIDAQCGQQALLGRPIKCSFTVKNTGNAVSANTSVTAPIPAGGSFVSADSGGALSGQNVVWNVGNLNPGDSKTVSMNVRTSAAGQYKCMASAVGACAAQVSDECATSAQGVPDIGTLVTDDDGVTTVGDNHIYTLEVKNQGQVNLTNVKMTFKLPAEIDFASATLAPAKTDGKTLTFDFGTLQPGATKVIKVTVKATKAGEYLVIGETTSDQTKFPVRDDEYTNFISRE